MKNRVYFMFVGGIVLSAYFIFGFAQLATGAYDIVSKGGNTFDEGTRVASLVIAEKTASEGKKLVIQEVNQWMENAEVFMEYNDKRVAMPKDAFQFNVDKTMNQVQDGKGNPILVEIKKEKIEAAIISISNSTVVNHLDYEKLQTDLKGVASQLQRNRVLALDEYVVVDKDKKEVVSSIAVNVGNQSRAINRWIELFPTITIDSQQAFSFLKHVENHKSQFTDEQLSVIASAIYQVILPTNVDILQRQTSRQLPTYAALGYEVNVNEKMDFVFVNPNATPYELQFTKKQNKLVVSLVGAPLMYTYQVVKKNQQSFYPRILVQLTSLLPAGEVKKIKQGKNGQYVEVFRMELDERGNLIQETKLGEDFYPPIPSVEEHSNVPIEPPPAPEDSLGGESPGNPNAENELKEEITSK